MEAYDAITAEEYDKDYPELNQAEYALFKRYIKEQPAPALEVGVGTGRLLLPYLKEGLDVEGFDPSPHMLDILQKKATAENLSPVIYQQSMQTLDLPKKYGVIFAPLYAMQYIDDWADVRKAIQKLYDHLLPGGVLLLTLHLPNLVSRRDLPAPNWQRVREGRGSDGKEVITFAKASFDNFNQLMKIDYRYEIKRNGEKFETLNTRNMRWYSPHEIELLLEAHGFTDVSVEDGKDISPPMMANSVTMLVTAKRP